MIAQVSPNVRLEIQGGPSQDRDGQYIIADPAKGPARAALFGTLFAAFALGATALLTPAPQAVSVDPAKQAQHVETKQQAEPFFTISYIPAWARAPSFLNAGLF